MGFGKGAESRGLGEALGRLFIQGLGLLYRGLFCVSAGRRKHIPQGLVRKALLLTVAVASTEWAIGWRKALVPYTLESPDQILLRDWSFMGVGAGRLPLPVPGGLPSTSLCR